MAPRNTYAATCARHGAARTSHLTKWLRVPLRIAACAELRCVCVRTWRRSAGQSAGDGQGPATSWKAPAPLGMGEGGRGYQVRAFLPTNRHAECMAGLSRVPARRARGGEQPVRPGEKGGAALLSGGHSCVGDLAGADVDETITNHTDFVFIGRRP